MYNYMRRKLLENKRIVIIEPPNGRSSLGSIQEITEQKSRTVEDEPTRHENI